LVAPQPSLDPWQHCLHRLGGDIPQQQFNTWIRPLQARWEDSGLVLAAPNRFIRDFVAEKYSSMINAYLLDVVTPASAQVSVIVATAAADHSVTSARAKAPPALRAATPTSTLSTETASRPAPSGLLSPSNLVEGYTFERFVEGKSNQLALAAAQQVAEHPGLSYNPLFLYGGVGLGKTHLMHAVGNAMRRQNPEAKIVYLHSERFVADMVKALQLNAINDFKRFYRSVDALLIDDIQFFANKDRSQEEFFSYFQCFIGGGSANDPHLRPVSERNRRSRGAFEVALWLGIDGGSRATRP
jgi:chromosomal replication initiator protein